MKCPNCHSRVSSKEEICPICDFQLKQNTKKIYKGIDDSLHEDYDLNSRRGYESTVDFSVQKPEHKDETPAERYSCRDSKHTSNNSNGDSAKYNPAGMILLGILTLPLTGALSMGLIILAAVTSNAAKTGDIHRVNEIKKCMSVLAVFVIIVTVISIIGIVLGSIGGLQWE